MLRAIAMHRDRFPATPKLDQTYTILGIHVIAAHVYDDARFLASSGRQAFASLRRGIPTTLPPPSRAFETEVVPFGYLSHEDVTSIAMVGSPYTVRSGLQSFGDQTKADELM